MKGIIAVCVVALLAGCPPSRKPTGPKVEPVPPGPAPTAPTISFARVMAPTDVPSTPPPPGTWRVHMIDVGTGLAILIQGSDFNLLYDAGTNDKGEKPLRVLAYLAAAIGASGDDLCVAKGAPRPTARLAIQHVVLSHPHFDHASALDEVIHCYDVKHLWDSGAVNQAVFYREVIEAIARATGLAYHTAAPVPPDRTILVKDVPIVIPKVVDWQVFSEGDTVQLGVDARLTLLHAEGKKRGDFNENSIVVAVDLGGARVLLVGDAESGPRADPTANLGDVEQHLVERYAKQIDADILQVGHHGSKTSSRRGFLQAVSPKFALVSAGPKSYGPVVLPDREVVDELVARGARVLRTDEHDAACPLTGRLGGDEGPGGCDSYILTIEKR